MFHTTTIFKGIMIFFFFVFIHNTSLRGQTVEHSSLQQLPNKEETKALVGDGETNSNTKDAFRLSNAGVPQGNSIEEKIARAEFYKAQYSHEPATQAKYQQAIDALKKEQVKTSTTKQD